MNRFFITRQVHKYNHWKEVTTINYTEEIKDKFLAWLRNNKYCSFDIETSGDQFSGRILLYSFCAGDKVFCFDGLTIKIDELLDSNDLWKNTVMIAHNAYYECKWLGAINSNLVPTNLWCTMVAEGKLLQGSGESLSLVNSLARHNIQAPAAMNKDIREDFNDSYVLHTVDHVLYNMGDTEPIQELMEKQQVLAESLKLTYYIRNIHMPLVRILAGMENSGWKLNEKKFLELSREAETKMQAIGSQMDAYLRNYFNVNPVVFNPKYEKVEDSVKRSAEACTKIVDKIRDLETTGKTHLKSYQVLLDRRTSEYEKLVKLHEKKSDIGLNWNSSKQILNMLKHVNFHPIPQARSTTTYKMQPSTSDGARKEWLLNNPNHKHKAFMEMLDEYQSYSKHVNSFGENFLNKYLLPSTGRVHTSYKQATVATGRLASGESKAASPRFNSQQIPRNKELRNCFIADDSNYKIITCDLSGAELVVMAALAKDSRLVELSKGDMHSFFANKGWKAIYDDRRITWKESDIISKDQNTDKRTDYKSMTFGSIYGLHDKKAAQTLNVSIREGGIAIKTIIDEIPDTIKFVEQASQEALSQGYIIHNTRTNSRRWFPNCIKSIKDEQVDHFTLTTEASAARNGKIQATQGDVLAEAMVLFDRYLRLNKLKDKVQFRFQVHDELVIHLHADIAEHIKKQLVSAMTRTANKYLDGFLEMEAEAVIEDYWTK